MFSYARTLDYQMFGEQIEGQARETSHRQRVAQGLHEILTILNSNCTLDDVLNYIIAQACRLFDTDGGSIYRLDRSDSSLRVHASHGLDAEIAALDLSVDSGPIGEVLLKREPLAISNTAGLITPGHEETQASHPLSITGSFLRLTRRYRAFVSIPIIITDQVYGAITLYYEEPRQFSTEELEWIRVLSDQTTLAIENARLVNAIQGKTILEERQRIARDLHDSVTQALYGISLYAEAATRLLASGDTALVKEHLSMLQSTALETLQEMRVLIFELRPPVLEQEGLVAALHSRLEAVEARSNLETKLIVRGANQLSSKVEQALYRIAQEALNNILKHAHASRATVSLRQDGPNVTLEISDDGVGFEATTSEDRGGWGFVALRSV